MRTTIHDNTANIERDHLVPDWSAGATEDGYIAGKPAIPVAQIQADYTQSNQNAADFIKNKPVIPAAQVAADWNSNSGVTQIANKPTIITNNQVVGIMTSIN
jgi:hypothetical protein